MRAETPTHGAKEGLKQAVVRAQLADGVPGGPLRGGGGICRGGRSFVPRPREVDLSQLRSIRDPNYCGRDSLLIE